MNVMEKYLAEKGTKGEFFLKLENVIEGKSRFSEGTYKIHKMTDRNGRKAIFYNYKGESFDVGDCVLLKATLTEYRSFDNEPVSYLNRVTVLENKGSTK